jgi:hypothetical protein
MEENYLAFLKDEKYNLLVKTSKILCRTICKLFTKRRGSLWVVKYLGISFVSTPALFHGVQRLFAQAPKKIDMEILDQGYFRTILGDITFN